MHYSNFLLQVLADQAVWAVCGRSSAVVDMSDKKPSSDNAKLTITVEVMPLLGGHLVLPKVRISKYIPSSASHGEGEFIKTGVFFYRMRRRLLKLKTDLQYKCLLFKAERSKSFSLS